MELENLKKIVEKIDPRCAIAFAGASEPFSNPHARHDGACIPQGF